MEITHTLGPRHWQIKLDEPSGQYWLSSRQRGDSCWQIEQTYSTEVAAISAVKNLKETFPAYYDAGHCTDAFDRQCWNEQEES